MKFWFFNAERFAYTCNLPDKWYTGIIYLILLSAGAHDHKACPWFFFKKNLSDLGLVKDGFK